MIKWFEALSDVSSIYAIIAIPSTVILVLQTILLLFGIGDGSDGSADIDVNGDGVIDPGSGADTGDAGLSLFSVRGIMAFFCVGSWSGMLFDGMSLPVVLTVLLSAACGFAALMLIAVLMKLMLKLQSSGNIDLNNAIGKVGEVYIPIPGCAKGRGKVNIIIQEKYSEVSAMTKDPDTIKTGEQVRVVSTNGLDMFVVERIIKTSNK
ncbi:MAG: NfeD family protein [Oscillospiraceae bacterium]|nr:NfeD family protein [Oscillospiraceae bacterium]